MRFGVFDHMDASGEPLAGLFENRLKLAEAYDRLGFYALHVAEHHSTPLGMSPERVRLAALDPESFYPAMGAQAADPAHRRHPGMHRTHTLDYCIVLSGEIWAVMDEGEVLLRAGDCLVQRGTRHAWSNRSEEPCVIAFVLVAAKPLP